MEELIQGSLLVMSGHTGVITEIRNFITPIFLLIVGVVALTFLFKRETTKLIQFMLIATLVGALLFTPDIIQNFATWIGGVLA